MKIIKLCLCCLFLLKGGIVLQAQDTLSLSKKWSNTISTWPFDFSTSVEIRNGFRTNNKSELHQTIILGELRWQLDAGKYLGNWGEVKGKIDIGGDYALTKELVDLRELNIDIYPELWWNLKIGRQILTWGKGDLVFINDLFSKDFPSFFAGRSIEYLKAPNDVLKLTIQPDWLQINLIYAPQFDPDRFLKAERISFYDPNISEFRGQNNHLLTNQPNDFFKDAEWYWRIQKELKGIEIAIYGYHGYWKSPSGFDSTLGTYIFPKLNVYGFSVEGSIAGGIFAFECGLYDSNEDRKGTNPLVNNSEFRWLANYNRDFKNDFSLSVQYYSETMMEYDNHVKALTALGGNPEKKRQDWITLRLRKLINKQRVICSLFTFYGVQAQDIYLRPSIVYQLNDYWKIDIGGNIFAGKNDTTFWNQFQFNNNLYIGLKWGI